MDSLRKEDFKSPGWASKEGSQKRKKDLYLWWRRRSWTKLRQVRVRADNRKEQRAWADTLRQTLRLK